MIPKIIHYCWFGDKSFGSLQEKCIDSWKKFLPDYKIYHWSSSDLPMKIPYVKKMYKNKRWAYLSDYIRFYALNKYGGIYFDTDVEVFKSFDDLLENEFFLGYESFNLVNGAVIGSVLGHKFGLECLNFYENSLYFKISSPPPIPWVLKKILKNNYNYPNIEQKDEFSLNCKIFPTEYFYSLPMKEKNNKNFHKYLTKNSYSIHHWEHSWGKKTSFWNDIKNTPWAFLPYIYKEQLINKIKLYLKN